MDWNGECCLMTMIFKTFLTSIVSTYMQFSCRMHTSKGQVEFNYLVNRQITGFKTTYKRGCTSIGQFYMNGYGCQPGKASLSVVFLLG